MTNILGAKPRLVVSAQNQAVGLKNKVQYRDSIFVYLKMELITYLVPCCTLSFNFLPVLVNINVDRTSLLQVILNYNLCICAFAFVIFILYCPKAAIKKTYFYNIFLATSLVAHEEFLVVYFEIARFLQSYRYNVPFQ